MSGTWHKTLIIVPRIFYNKNSEKYLMKRFRIIYIKVHYTPNNFQPVYEEEVTEIVLGMSKRHALRRLQIEEHLILEVKKL